MKIFDLAWTGLACSAIAACSGAATVGPGGDDGGGSDASGDAATDGASDGAGGDANEGGNPDSGGPCSAPQVNLTFGSCTTTNPCGGAIADGLYWYTTGCIPDPWAKAKQGCPSMKVSNEHGTVQGCVAFAGGSVARDVKASYGADLAVPTSCLFGGSCAQLEGLLKQSFTTASCATSSTGCDCTVTSSYTGTAGGTYTTTSSQIVTSVGNHYDYCVNGNSMDVRWASGPNPEAGNYTLTKQ